MGECRELKTINRQGTSLRMKVVYEESDEIRTRGFLNENKAEHTRHDYNFDHDWTRAVVGDGQGQCCTWCGAVYECG